MTALMAPVVAGAHAAPQVNLLPPEIRAARTLNALKRVLLLGLVALLALCGLAFALAAMQAQAARDEAADEQAETQRLLAAQQQYAEVPQVLGQLALAEDARRLGMSTEIVWGPYLAALMTSAPPNVQFAEIAVTGSTPMLAVAPQANPLHEPSAVTLSFTGRAATLPDVAAWIRALETVEGFQDAYVTTAAIAQGTSGAFQDVVHYEVSGTVQVAESAYALRFESEED